MTKDDVVPESSLVSVRLPDDLREAVDALAREGQRSRSFIVKEAVAAYVEERRAYLQAIGEAIEEAEREGTISHEAFSRWLSSWGTENELPPPEPDIPPRGLGHSGEK